MYQSYINKCKSKTQALIESQLIFSASVISFGFVVSRKVLNGCFPFLFSCSRNSTVCVPTHVVLPEFKTETTVCTVCYDHRLSNVWEVSSLNYERTIIVTVLRKELKKLSADNK